MTPLELDSGQLVSDADIQSKIAEALQVYRQIDLTIPAQRAVADRVRIGNGFAPLSPLGNLVVNQEFVQITGGAKDIK